MRLIQQRSFGGPGVLTLVDAPPPSPLATEILVRVRAIGLNPVDAIVRAGIFPLIGPPPFTVGWDVSGVVEHVVPGTSRFVVGDEVIGMPLFPRAANAYAEYVAAPSRHFARKPVSIDHPHAAGLPMAGLTAWQALVEAGQVKPGERVLVHGAGGGVGHLAVQIAHELGAHVIATASKAKTELVKRLGAHEVIDYRAVDFSEVVRDVDVVIESIGGDNARRSLRTLRRGGRLVTLVERTNADLARETERAGFRFAGVAVEPDYVALEELARWVDEGKLSVHVDAQYPLEAAAEAHRHLEAGGLAGKLVLTT